MKKHRKSLRNVSPSTMLLGGIVLVGGSIATFLGARWWMNKREREFLEPEIKRDDVVVDEDAWQKRVDIEAAMPKSSDFPMGWKTNTSPGFNQRISTGGLDEPLYKFVHRILELNAPSDACSPTPCNFVAVFSGANDHGETVRGWWPFRTYQEAGEKLIEEERVVSVVF